MNAINNKLKIIFILILGITMLMGCRKYFPPSTAIDEQSALSNAGDIETATIGTYALFKDAGFVRSGHFLMEYPSDEIAQGQNSSDDLTRLYRYTHLPTGAHAASYWSQSYKAASAANRVVEAILDNSTPALLQLKGENLFIRAMMHFYLVRIFGRPYVENGGSSLGVPILKEGLTEEQKNTLKRSTVKEVYDFVVADLIKAADYMTVKKTNAFASKEVAYALLSRVYLYMGENQKAIDYANLVINSNRYSLVTGSSYANYFRGVPEGNAETIFCIRHIKTEDRGYGAIGSMYFSGDASGNALGQATSGWGEIYASKKYVDSVSKNPNDLRINFISPYKLNGVLQMNTKLNPNTPMYYINKYNLQEGIINLSSPVYIRLAEMYLIRAEANAKLGNVQLALDDVNIIRKRAGLAGNELCTVASITLENKTVLDAVLYERWLELAFEGHRHYDLFRNGKPVVRNYPGSQVTNGNVNQTINPTDARVIHFIPQVEIDRNKNLEQNP